MKYNLNISLKKEYTFYVTYATICLSINRISVLPAQSENLRAATLRFSFCYHSFLWASIHAHMQCAMTSTTIGISNNRISSSTVSPPFRYQNGDGNTIIIHLKYDKIFPNFSLWKMRQNKDWFIQHIMNLRFEITLIIQKSWIKWHKIETI